MITIDEHLKSIENENKEFWVVVIGRSPGIYGDSESAKEQLRKFPNRMAYKVIGWRDAVRTLQDGLLDRIFSKDQPSLRQDEWETLWSCMFFHGVGKMII